MRTTSHARGFVRRASSAGALVVAAAVVLATPGSGASEVAKTFPELAARKAALPPLTLVVDCLVYTSDNGVTDIGFRGEIFMDKSRATAADAITAFSAALAARGYGVARSLCLSVGQTRTTDADFLVGNVRAPFFVDSTALRRAPSRSAWDAVVSWVSRYQRVDSHALDALPQARVLCDSLGAGAIAVVTLVNREASKPRKRGDIGASTASRPAEELSSPSSDIFFAIVDGKTGEILWCDSRRGFYNLTPKLVRGRAADLVADLP